MEINSTIQISQKDLEKLIKQTVQQTVKIQLAALIDEAKNAGKPPLTDFASASQYLSANELRQLLHTRPSTIEQWVAEGLPYVSWTPARRLFDKDVVKQWIADNKQEQI